MVSAALTVANPTASVAPSLVTAARAGAIAVAKARTTTVVRHPNVLVMAVTLPA
jgi:hypothetical protein